MQPLPAPRLQLLAHQEVTSVIIQMDELTMCCATMHRDQARAAWILRLRPGGGPGLSHGGQNQDGSSVLCGSCAEDVDMFLGSVRDPALKQEDYFEHL